MGLLTLVCLIVGNMIGVGLYVGGAYSLLSLRDARLVMIVWLVGGVHAICGAVAYGAVVNRLPISGGEYTFLSRCVHPLVGFMAGWISLIAGFPAPIAATALLIGKYATIEGTSDLTSKWIATVSILLAAMMMAFHLKLGSWVNNGVIVIKFVCFAIFLSIGIPIVMQGAHSGLLPDTSPETARASDLWVRLSERDTVVGMMVSLFYVSLAYTGFNASIYLAGEVDGKVGATGKKSWLVSRSMIIASVLVTAIYLLLNWVFLFGASPELIVADPDRYVVKVADVLGGDWFSVMMRVAIILSVITSILAMMAVGPMVYVQMAADGKLPKIFGMQSGSPRVSIATQTLLSCILVWSSDILGIISYLGLTLTACGALAVSSIWFAKKELSRDQPIAWYEHVATAIYVTIAILFLPVAYMQEDRRIHFWLCIATFASGALFFLIYRRYVEMRRG